MGSQGAIYMFNRLFRSSVNISQRSQKLAFQPQYVSKSYDSGGTKPVCNEFTFK